MRRVYQVAKEFGISSKALLRLLRRLGFNEATSPMGPVSDEMISACQAHFEKNKEKLRLKEIEKRKIRTKVRKSAYERLKERRLLEKQRAEKKLRETMTKIEMGERIRKYKKEPKIEEKEEEPLKIRLAERTSVRELASFLRTEPLELISKCLKLGLMVTINQRLDYETASTIASEYGYETELTPTYEEEKEVVVRKTEPRPPIVTVMGHVDHGKTTLLDYIRHTHVVAQEVGKITQHIGAYKVKVKGGESITFIDTPGHHAFTAMRVRGAQITDIVVLIVAADEGVKAQTIEAINHAKDAGVPIIVAINKIDLPNAEPEKVEKQLMEHNLVTEKCGGEVLCCEISAKTGKGVEELLDAILMQAELLELKAIVDKEAEGVIIETKLDKGKGVVATAIMQHGVLKVGTPILAGNVSGKVRALYNEWGKNRTKASPSDPIQIVGFDELPQVGDVIKEIKDEKLAREISKMRAISMREEIAKVRRPVVEDITQQLEAEKVKELKLIIKGDVAGTAEALSDALHHLSCEEAKINVIHQGAGEISESDVLLAAASGALIIGFNIKESKNARQLAKERGVEIRTYNIIYEAIEEMQLALKGLLPPKIEVYKIGKAEVKQVFKISKIGYIAGCYVVEGKVVKGENVRVKRDDIIVYEGKIESLKRMKDSVNEVIEGLECGIGLGESFKFEIGDIIEVYGTREVER